MYREEWNNENGNYLNEAQSLEFIIYRFAHFMLSRSCPCTQHIHSQATYMMWAYLHAGWQRVVHYANDGLLVTATENNDNDD